MINRKALMLSVGTTAFVVVLAGGIYAGYAQSPAPAEADVSIEDALNDPQVQQVLREREAAYQEMLEQANQRLISQSEGSDQAVEEEYPISVGLAVALGQNALGGGTLIRNAELVSVNGRAAYELIFDRGQVYIDAISGAILYNSNASAQVASSGGSHREHEDEGHEEHEDFDD
ncbi:MAG: hypothetical protein PVF85_08850 [Anaerolineales bacterium]|jgi:hypothetical protein